MQPTSSALLARRKARLAKNLPSTPLICSGRRQPGVGQCAWRTRRSSASRALWTVARRTFSAEP